MDKRMIYVTPLYNNGDGTARCKIYEAIGNHPNDVWEDNYSKEMFEKHFNGALTIFEKNSETIKKSTEIAKEFGLSFVYAAAVNLKSFEVYASDGVAYSLRKNFFVDHNPIAFEWMRNDLKSVECDSCYIQLMIEDKTGHVLDITHIVNPSPYGKLKFAYEHRIEKGFVPTNIKGIGIIKPKKSLTSKEKMKQEDIDNLLKELQGE